MKALTLTIALAAAELLGMAGGAQARHHVAHHGFPCPLGQIFRPSMGVCQGMPYQHSARHAVHHQRRHVAARTRTRIVYRDRLVYRDRPGKPVERIVYRDRPIPAPIAKNPPVTAAAPAIAIPTAWAGNLGRRSFGPVPTLARLPQ